MSESREELIARRDALIEQLQGEWATRNSLVVPLITAFEVAKMIVMLFGGFLVATAVVGVVANLILGNDMSHIRLSSMLLLLGGMLASFAGIAFLLTLAVCSWLSRPYPVQVSGTVLKLSGRKQSEVSLKHLTHYWTPHDERSDRADRRACLQPQWVGHWRERWDLDRYWLYPVQIRPSAFQRGQDLVQLLDQVASLNDGLDKGDS